MNCEHEVVVNDGERVCESAPPPLTVNYRPQVYDPSTLGAMR